MNNVPEECLREAEQLGCLPLADSVSNEGFEEGLDIVLIWSYI